MTGHLRRATLLSLLLLAAGGRPAWAELSVLDYLSIQQGRDQERKADLKLYLAGVLEGLLTFNELSQSLQVNVLCIPPDATLNLPDFEKSVDEAIAETREERTDFTDYAQKANISVMGLVALNRSYPCEDPAEGEGGAEQ